jgi:hypothetical protein
MPDLAALASVLVFRIGEVSEHLLAGAFVGRNLPNCSGESPPNCQLNFGAIASPTTNYRGWPAAPVGGPDRER